MISSPPIPTAYDDIADTVRSGARLLPTGSGSKPALSKAPEGYTSLSTSGLNGIVEYDPSEFTITARAGTPLRDLVAALAEHGQYLPWDPPFVEAGATLGGAIASGLSGSGRYRYGGLRDFLVGVRFVDGTGRIVRGGGKVVKNAAGFDLPKLFVGSIGRLGILLEATFKVFPQPPAWTTLRLLQSDIASAQRTIATLARAPLDLNALDLEIDGQGTPVLWMRIGGLAAALPERAERLRLLAGGGTVVDDAEERDWWQATAGLSWAFSDGALLYAALLPSRLAQIDAELKRAGVKRRYLCGGSILWVATESQQSTEIDALLARLGLTAIRVRGAGELLLNPKGTTLLARVKSTLDPQGIFPAW